jgi:GNAT superfamily N-acetyltransferase
MNLTLKQFDALISGETKSIRPKFIRNPDTGETYALVSTEPDSKSYRNAKYEKVSPQANTTYFYKLSEQDLTQYEDQKFSALPPGIEIKFLTLKNGSDSDFDPQKHITKRQLYELISTIGRDSSWWPLDDLEYDDENYIKNPTCAVMFSNGKPAGLHLFNSRDLKQKGEVTAGYIGILPDFRGQGLGKKIITYVLHHLTKEGCNAYYLDTSDSDIISKPAGGGAAVSAYHVYECLGFKRIYTAELQSDDTIQAIPGLPINPSKFNISANYYTQNGKPRPRYTDEAMHERLNSAFSSPSR